MTIVTASLDAPDEAITLRRLLNRLPTYLENGWNDLDDARGYFGDGSCSENGIRSNTNLVFAIAVLLTQDDSNALPQVNRERLTLILRKLVRYLTAAHNTQQGQCAQGGQWGQSWQSSWWATKLALGTSIAQNVLAQSDIEAVHVLVAKEADRHLTRMIPTGLAHDTKAEETAWDTEILATALAMLPEHPNAAHWRRRLIEFGVNSFSRPSDRNSDLVVDDIPLREMLRSCNIHEDGSLENHGTTHFCYVASPLISKAWSAHALKRAQQDVPAALVHNVEQVWDFAEPTFLENRFAYIGGQDWARYTYGEYFILPALLFLNAIDCGTCTGTIFRRRLRLLEMEANASSDGSFFGARFTKGRYSGQFAKYETDCFACVALALDMLGSGNFAIGPGDVTPPPRILTSPESLCCYVRTPDRFMSFAWSTLTQGTPNVTFVPLADDSLAEWHEANLLGAAFFGRSVDWVGVKAMEATDTGLRVEGTHSLRNARGQGYAEHHLSLTLDADTLRIRSTYTAQRKLPVVHLTGLNWRLPNDVFNDFSRLYYFEDPAGTVTSYESRAGRKGQGHRPLSRTARIRRKARQYGTLHAFGNSRWLNVDNQIGIVMLNAQSLVLRRYPQKEAPWNSLNVEQVEAPAARWRFNVPAGAVLLDTDCLVHLGTHEETRKLANET